MASHRLTTSAGPLAFARGTLWYFPARTALLRLQDLHRRAIGGPASSELAAVRKLTAADAARVYREALRCALGQFMASSSAGQLAITAHVLDFAAARRSFDGIESLALSGLATARSLGRSDVVYRASSLIARLGAPARPGGGLPASLMWNAQRGVVSVVGSVSAAASGASEGRQPSADETWAREFTVAALGAAGAVVGGALYPAGSLLISGASPDRSTRPLIDDLDAMADKGSAGWAAGKAIGELIGGALWSAGGARVFQALEDAGVIRGIQQLGQAIHQSISQAAKQAVDTVSNAAKALANSLAGFSRTVGSAFGKFLGGLAGAAYDAASALAGATKRFGSEAGAALSGFLGAMWDLASGFASTVGGAAADAVGSFLGALGIGSNGAGTAGGGDSGDASSADPPTEPTEPDEPADPADPADPDELADPDDPGDPDHPDDDSGYIDPDADNPYAGGGTPMVSFTAAVGGGLDAFVSMVDGDDGGVACGPPRMGPLGVAAASFLQTVPVIQLAIQRQGVQFTDPGADGITVPGDGLALGALHGSDFARDPTPLDRASLAALGALLTRLTR